MSDKQKILLQQYQAKLLKQKVLINGYRKYINNQKKDFESALETENKKYKFSFLKAIAMLFLFLTASISANYIVSRKYFEIKNKNIAMKASLESVGDLFFVNAKNVETYSDAYKERIENNLSKHNLDMYYLNHSEMGMPFRDQKNVIVTSEYGWRWFENKWEFHTGVDLFPSMTTGCLQ